MKSIYSDRSVIGIAFGVTLVAAGFLIGGPAPAPVAPQNPGEPAIIERFLTHVTTDKPIYRTGEKLYVRGVILRADGHSPVPTPRNTNGGVASFEIKGPKGDTVASGNTSVIDSVAGFSWDIPPSQAGGEYTIRISHPSGNAPGERKFDIRAYRAPRLKSQIVFVRDGYGPGDTVTANLHVERAEGGIPSGAKVSVSARIDGEEAWNGSTAVDSAGNAGANFKLPAVIARGEGVIAMVIEDGGVLETATKTIPILLQTVDLAIYPEGGDLIAGLSNRVYIEGRTPAQKPADMAGIIVNAAGSEVAMFRTEHEGRGRFSFVPARGEAYSLRVTEPAGIKTIFPLPAVKESGVVISSTSDITARQKDVVLRVAASTEGAYIVALSQHGKEVNSRPVALRANRPSDVTIEIPKSVDGVIVATVYDDRKTPMAERLLFRQPEHSIKMQVVPDRVDYVPGDRVTLKVTTTDDSGKPVGAIVGLTVTDSSVLELIEKREQAPRLPVMVLLENDVKNLSDAHVYLDESNPKAPLATDLLLGTQGWRRFAKVDPAKFLTAYGDSARRVLAIPMLTDQERQRAALQANRELDLPRNEDDLLQYLEQLAKLREANNINITVDGFQGAPRGGVGGFVGGRAGGVVGGVPGGVPSPPPPAPIAVLGAPAPGVINPDLVGEIRLIAEPVDAELGNQQLARAGAPAAAGGRGAAAGGGGGRGGAAGRGGPALAQRAALLTVREYAHPLRPGWVEGARVDFAETVYWNAGVRTDATTGAGTVSFNLSDSVTSFRVLADAFTQEGALGSSISEVESVKPFSIEPKFPLQVTSGDIIQLPIGIINGMNRELRGTEVTAKGTAGIQFTMLGDNADSLRARERARRFLQLDVAREYSGVASLVLDARAGSYRDTVGRNLDVQPMGFPHESSTGGVLETNGTKSLEFTLPSEFVRGSVTSSVSVYPTPLASMTDALQSLLRQPNGCFEQTSSTSYPMVMAQQYFLTHTGIDPAIVSKAKDLLDASYKRLTGFESSTRGYEWFGANPGHEALTAYGLMQFTDMSQVRDVDKEMVQRTRAWLLARRDGNGTFSLNSKAIDSFGRAPADTTNAYIVWALVESGEKGLEKEVASVKTAANATQDSYVVALAANILHATGDRNAARQLMARLVKDQETAGNVKGANTSITRSGGDALAIETTALSVLAWMREPEYAVNVEKGLRWIIESNKGGRFGSTQSTILALRSIVAYDAANARPKAPGRIVLMVDGKMAGSPLAFTANTQGALVMPEFAKELGPGKHTVALRMEEGSSMPFSINVKYFSVLPESSEQTQVGIQVALKDKQIQEGGVTEATVSIANKSNEVIPTPVAIVGIPGGLEVRHDQLKELVKSGKIDAYEVIGREVVLYWRYIKAKDKFDLPLSLIAAVPGTYTGPASRAYLYYTDEFKNWAPGLKVVITRR